MWEKHQIIIITLLLNLLLFNSCATIEKDSSTLGKEINSQFNIAEHERKSSKSSAIALNLYFILDIHKKPKTMILITNVGIYPLPIAGGPFHIENAFAIIRDLNTDEVYIANHVQDGVNIFVDIPAGDYFLDSIYFSHWQIENEITISQIARNIKFAVYTDQLKNNDYLKLSNLNGLLINIKKSYKIFGKAKSATRRDENNLAESGFRIGENGLFYAGDYTVIVAKPDYVSISKPNFKDKEKHMDIAKKYIGFEYASTKWSEMVSDF